MSSVIQMNGTRRESVGKGRRPQGARGWSAPGVVRPRRGAGGGHGRLPRVHDPDAQAQGGANPIVNLNLGGHEVTALVRDAQIDPISQAVLHVDFQHISLTEKITVEVLCTRSASPRV